MDVFSLSLLMFWGLFGGVFFDNDHVSLQNGAKAFTDNYDVELFGYYFSDLELVHDYTIGDDLLPNMEVTLPVAIVLDYSLREQRRNAMKPDLYRFSETQAPALWQTVPGKVFDIENLFAEERRRLRIPGIVYNETSGVYPALKTGLKPNGIIHWDDDSRLQLHRARLKVAAIANDGRKKMAGPFIPPEISLSRNGLAQWEDCKLAASLSEGVLSSNEHFVIWPSEDGKSPMENPRIKAKWPYEYRDNIHEVYGPFRVPVQVGDVPAGDNVYIFFYKDVP